MYLRPLGKDTPPDIEKAEKIYRTALGQGLDDEDVLLDRLDECE